MKHKDLVREIKKEGWWLAGGSRHEKWTNGVDSVMVPRHREINEMTAREILKMVRGEK